MDRTNIRVRPRPRKAELSVRYVVRNKDEVDNLKARFAEFTKRCDVFDTAGQENKVPCILAMDADEKTINVNLDASCEVVLRDFGDIRTVTYGIGSITLDLGITRVCVKIGIMGPEEA